MAITRFVELQCGACGVFHCIPEVMYNDCKRLGGFWHCPNGHQRGWAEGEQKTEINRLKQQLAQRDDEIREKEAALINSKRALTITKKRVKKLEIRASGGACPCCNRSFVNMARHMKTKHPEFAPTRAGVVVPMKAS